VSKGVRRGRGEGVKGGGRRERKSTRCSEVRGGKFGVSEF
jgi:hypothetical protein